MPKRKQMPTLESMVYDAALMLSECDEASVNINAMRLSILTDCLERLDALRRNHQQSDAKPAMDEGTDAMTDIGRNQPPEEISQKRTDAADPLPAPNRRDPWCSTLYRCTRTHITEDIDAKRIKVPKGIKATGMEVIPDGGLLDVKGYGLISYVDGCWEKER